MGQPVVKLGMLARLLGALGYEKRTGLEDIFGQAQRAAAAAGIPVTSSVVAGLPAVHAAVSIAAEAVAGLPMRVWRGELPRREVVTNAWQAKLFAGAPNSAQTAFDFWETVQASLDYRGNAYIWKSKDDAGRVLMLWALHPDQVAPAGAGPGALRYQVTFSDNYPAPLGTERYGGVTVDSSTILHIRGRSALGALVAPSPLTRFRLSLGAAAAKQQHEATVYRLGAAGGLVVTFPGGVSKQQADLWREDFDAQHSGPYNVGRTKVIGGGASVTSIGMTQKDAEYVEAMNLSVLDIARIFRVPAWLLGIDQKIDRPQSPEHEQDRWLRHGLVPRLNRIEAAVNADLDLFSPMGMPGIYAAFDTSRMIRGDLQTEAEISLKKVQSGQWLIDEARAKDGLPPLPGGIGSIPHIIVPVGGSPYGVADPTAGRPQKETEDDAENT